MNAVGEEVLEAAIGSLRKELPGSELPKSRSALDTFLSRNKQADPPPQQPMAAPMPTRRVGGNGAGASNVSDGTADIVTPLAGPVGGNLLDQATPSAEGSESRRRSR